MYYERNLDLMKSAFLIFSIALVNLVHSQVIRIKVYEKMEFNTFDSVGILSAVSQIPSYSFFELSDCEYVLDLSKKTGQFYVAGVLDIEFEITFENIGSLNVINFFVKGYDLTEIGIVVNLDASNESFDWFSKDIDDFYNIVKGTKFEIVKGV